ncbi:MAG: hypothetical protein JSR34_02620 [Proteobacteria bacterium]|nr:hypothetical protein [Pseudomonadota bacterium]
MKLQPSKYQASWFLFGALVASEPWSWFLGPPADLAPQLLHSTGAVWRAVFGGTSLLCFLAFAAGNIMFRSNPPRALSMAIGAMFGLGIVAATRLPLLARANFGPLMLSSAAVAFLAGLVVGFRVRRANYALKRTCAE